MALDVFLDVIGKNSSPAYLSSIHANERFLFCVLIFVLGVIFLVFRTSDNIAVIYIVEFYCKNIALQSLALMTAYSETIKDSVLLKCNISTYTLSTLLAVLGAYTTFYNRFYDQDSKILSILGVFAVILVLTILIILLYWEFYWFRIVAIRQKSSIISYSRLTFSEKKYFFIIIPNTTLYLFRGIWFLVNIKKKGNYWQMQSETSLIVDFSVQLFCIGMISIIIGRVIRDIVVTKENTLKLKQIFVRHVSHEIRSPLNVVHAGLDLLMSEIKEVDTNEDFVPISRSTMELIQHIFSSSESAIDILNDLLHYEQIDAGIFNLELSWRGLEGSFYNKLIWAQILAQRSQITLSIVDSTIATVSPRKVNLDIEQNGGMDQTHLHPQRDVYLHIDVFRMDQVIRNMITNAMKFTSAGGQVWINISCELQNVENRNKIISKFGVEAVGIFRLEVVDTGVGLSVNDQQKIFGEFIQFNKDELQGGGGSGLGLWISKKIVQMHNGNMGVTSLGLGHGTTVFFELPLFSCVSAGKQPLTMDFPPYYFSTENATSSLSNIPSTDVKKLPSPASPLTPIRFKPRTTSLPTKRSAIVAQVSDADDETTKSSFHTQPPQQQVIDSFPNVSEIDERITTWLEKKKKDQVKCSEESQMISFMIVDDSSLNRKVVVKLIESEKNGRLQNARLLEADDGTSAVEMLRQEMAAGRMVDFVLMDFVMIRMNGPEAASIIRKDLNYTGVIIGVTGNALPDDVAMFVACGANEVVIKPLTKKKLMTALSCYFPLIADNSFVRHSPKQSIDASTKEHIVSNEEDDVSRVLFSTPRIQPRSSFPRIGINHEVELDSGTDSDSFLPVQSHQEISILIVDDIPLDRTIITKLIESEKSGRLRNARILEAVDGTTSIEVMRKELSEGRQIDFVLMDYVMIQMHGPEASSIMRNDLKYTGTIIGVTGNALPDDMARFVACGANEVLTKPLTKMKLTTTLFRYLPSIADHLIRPSPRNSIDVSFFDESNLQNQPTLSNKDDESRALFITPSRIQPLPSSPLLLTSSDIFIRDAE
eukprot:CAMPEP_0201105420 /NCGR_PEP_ID=MMETSP0812-20130820/45790_1 /ASSEMBLY_ACC=CAM_ASM_000668 /TAXON_ID=98059 /ORGANISM="Dinobryon sp., Strain UTEXLB2267" /LENGTH=1046 /DNA_ID=CAMNT_0047365263 /DNA_START=202 /DNA_END=3342 /DNA_ORIENTATION=+